MLDAEHRLAFAQLNGAAMLFEAHLNPAAAVQVDHRTIGQGYLATLAQGCGKLGRVRRRLLQPVGQAQANCHRQHTGGHGIAQYRSTFAA
ncbi:hypothetical protein D9M73_283550 [compost metagenome]